MDYQNLYTNFKNNSDVDEEQCAPFFEKATDEEIKSLTDLYNISVFPILPYGEKRIWLD